MEKFKTILQTWAAEMGPTLGAWVLAIVIIIIGYFVVKIISSLLEKLLGKWSIDEKISKQLGKDAEGTERGISKFVFYLLMLFVVVFALGVAGKSDAVEPLTQIIDQIFAFRA